MPKTKAPTAEERRAEMYDTVKATLKKLKRGQAVTERELRLTKKCYIAFMELFDVFRPSIKSTLEAQQAEIDELIASYEDSDEEDEDD
jgi:hypothetical protein